MQVSGIQGCFLGLHWLSLYEKIVVYSTIERKSYMFGTTWEWVNDRIFIFERYPSKSFREGKSMVLWEAASLLACLAFLWILSGFQ